MRMYGALVCNIASFFLEHANSNKSLIWRAGSPNPNNHLCKIYLQNVSFWKVHNVNVFLIQHCGILSSQLLLGGPMRTRCACVGVLEGRQFISVPASRHVFANSAKPLQQEGRQSVGERESPNPQSKLQRLLQSCTASEKHTKVTLLHDHAQTSWPPSSWYTVKGKSHGIPARQYGHKRECAQLWSA